MPEPGPRGVYIGSPDTDAERPSLIVGQTTEASGSLGAAWVHPTYGDTDEFAHRVTKEAPLPISGRVELYDPLTLALTSTPEIPFAVSGQMTPGEIFPMRLDAYATALREDPLPISGRVELSDQPQVRLFETATAEYTRESPVPVSGMVGLYEVPPMTMTYSESTFLPVSGALVGASNSPILYNVELGVSGVEYSQALASPLYGFDAQASGAYDVRMAFLTGKVGGGDPLGPWVTIKSGQSYGKEFMNARTGLTLFFATDFNDNVTDPLAGEYSRGVQIVAWTE